MVGARPMQLIFDRVAGVSCLICRSANASELFDDVSFTCGTYGTLSSGHIALWRLVDFFLSLGSLEA